MTASGWLVALAGPLLVLGGRAGARWAMACPPGGPEVSAGAEAGWLAGVARAFGVAVPGSGAVAVVAVGLIAAVAAVAYRSPVSVLAVVAAAEVAPWHRCRRVHPPAAGSAALIAATEDLASRLAGGASLLQAIALLPPGTQDSPAQGLAAVSEQVRRGAPLQASIDHWASRCGDDDAVLLADALALAGRTGASQAAALSRVVATTRERSLLRGEVRAHAAQARASAIVLVVAPIVFATAMAAADRSVRHVLVGTPLGWACIAAGVLLDLLGAWWMRAAIRGVR